MATHRNEKFHALNDAALPTAADALFPEREYGRRGIRFHNKGAAEMTIVAPSTAQLVVAAGAQIEIVYPFVEDGAYTVTGTATQTFDALDTF